MLPTAQNRVKSRLLQTPLIISGTRHARRRQLATPSAPTNSPAALAQRSRDENTSTDQERTEMRAFLRKRPVVMLPSPLPPKTTLPASPLHYHFFPDTPTLDKLAIMEACLNGFLDMQRAHQLFMDALKDEKLKWHLDVRIYNVFLKTYLEYAESEERQGHNAKFWRRQVWDLYEGLEKRGSSVQPNAFTYAVILRGLTKSPEIGVESKQRTTAKALRSMDQRSITLASVVDHHILSDPTDRVAVIQLIAQSAAGAGPRDAVMEKLASIGVTQSGGKDVLDDVEEVKTQQKRKIIRKEIDGIETQAEILETPYNLSILRSNLNSIIKGRKALPDDVLQRQKLLEETAYDSALARLKHEASVFKDLDMGANLKHRSLQAWMWDWHVCTEPYLEKAIEELIEQEKEKAKGRGKQIPIGSFLKLLPPSKLVLIAVMELLNMLAGSGYVDGARTTRIVLTIGAAIEAEHHFQSAKKQDIPVMEFKNKSELPTYSVQGYLEMHKERVKAKLELEGRENWMPNWTQEVRARVGAFVVDAVMECAKVVQSTSVEGTVYEEEQQAFYNTYRYERGFKIGIIKVNDVIIEKMSKEPPKSNLHPRHLPMVARPRPWLRHNAGGYLYSNSSVMRMKESSEQNSYLKEADSRGALELVYAGLDVLGKTPWKINSAVFAVALEVWNAGLEYPRIPPAELEQEIPAPPMDKTDMKAKADWAVQVKRLKQEKSAHHSDRCSTNYKMEIARTFLGEKFYLPHNVDFRGRAYPIPPHLNQMGDDLSRGLLMFAEGKPLGPRGIRWIKIHLSNLFGYDKASFDDREIFATEHLRDIYDSAENPVNGQQWWLKADDPWQCLATCIELRNALESPDPEAYISCLPVHQDGTCNGLQHYAALGGDVIGAKQVNLDVSDKPSDVYTYVAEMAKAQIERDAAEGHELALMLKGKVNRKVVKQTVMTTVYGVTFIGARDQIHRQLKNAEDHGSTDIYPWANYLAKVTLSCIGTLFKGAKSIQLWLNDCARLISKSIPEDRVRLMLLANKDHKDMPAGMGVTQNRQWVADKKGGKEQMTTVVWTTLLGLPIVQPYRKAGRKQIMTQLQTVYISDPNQPQSVNTTKQVSAFPPNFVHSLDATHMMLTALQCDREGMTFAAVHDSYWTHAASIDDMSSAIRDCFVHLHSSNVLENLLTEFRARYKGYKLPVEVFKSRSNLAAIAKSPMYKKVKEMVGDQVKEDIEDEVEAEEEAIVEAEAAEEAVPVKAKRGPKPRVPKVEPVPFFDAKKRRSPKELAEIEGIMSERYVDLIDVLPPLPEKGEFNIETIKDSQYFFS